MASAAARSVTPVTPIGRTLMPDRPCRHCKGQTYASMDCYVFETVHRKDCPMLTGLFEVEEQDLWNGTFHVGMMCPGCRCELRTGDSYVKVPDHEFNNVVTCMCVGCGALASV